MSDDDPFAEPGDTERTVIKPSPLGRRAAPVEPMVAPPDEQTAPADTPDVEVPAKTPVASSANTPEAMINLAMTGMNRLNASASTLFALVSRIRNRAQHVDPAELRKNAVAEVRGFESRAIKAGVDPQIVKVARYAICATIDDVVLNTPWGGESTWTQQPLVGTFHRENVGGDRFFDVLARLEKDPGQNLEALEFMYMCLSLGFEGRLRVDAGGQDKHLQIRNGLSRLIRRTRGAVEADLSPHWKGVQRAHKQLSAWTPVWIAIAALTGVLSLGFFGLSWALGGSTDAVMGKLAVLDTGVTPELERRAPPPPPPPPPPGETTFEKVSIFLEAEINEGLVSVLDDANTVTIRIVGTGMFGSGSDALKPAFVEPLVRVATALNDEPGPIIVAGHSDNIPINTARFPSNTHLSLARAQSVMRTLAVPLDNPDRLTAEGRAEKEPIASNDTREGRAKNRRIEVVLVKTAGRN